MNKIDIKIFNRIEQIPAEDWDSLVPGETVGLQRSHLGAVEQSGINQIQPFYFLGYKGDRPIGIAYGFILKMNFARMSNQYSREVLDTLMTWDDEFMETTILEMGHIASLGSTILGEASYEFSFLEELTPLWEEIASKEQVDLILIRDVDEQRHSLFKNLESQGFRTVLGFPLAMMDLRWDNLEGYLSALKSKKRNRLIRSQEKLNVPEIEVEIIEDYAPHAHRLAELWTEVAKSNNGYEHEQLTPEYFISMARNLRGRSHVTAIKRHGEIIAYGLNLIGELEYFGMAEGLDYSYRDQYDLYVNNILLGLDTACQLGKSRYNIGVTTYDFKTSLGAELIPQVYYVKAPKNPRFTAVYAELIAKSIEQPENHHRAFHHQDSQRISLKALLEKLEQPKDGLDPFEKHLRYTRVDTARLSGLYNYFPQFDSAQQSLILQGEREVILMGTNSYLGLATHPLVKDASIRAVEVYGSGCSGSPLLNGTLDIHNKLSRQLAHWVHKEEALLFPTGYQANVGALSSLVGRRDVVLMDRRNHASLLDGVRLSGAMLVRYNHRDLASLEGKLEQFRDRPKLVVSDSLFSMEGTMVDLPAMVQLCKKYHARLMLDESHALGVFGPSGGGVAEHFGLTDRVDILMGTFSKSLASVGGFIAGEERILDTLKHKSRGHIFSASLPPASVAAASQAVELIQREPEQRKKLLDNARYMREGLQDLGYHVDGGVGPILPVYCGDEMIALGAYGELLKRGVYVNPVTWPAVPKGQEILRVSLMATHNKTILDRALEQFRAVRTNYWPHRAA